MSPIKCGILNLLRKMGAKRMIKSIKEKISTGLLSGNVKSNIFNMIIILLFIKSYQLKTIYSRLFSRLLTSFQKNNFFIEVALIVFTM